MSLKRLRGMEDLEPIEQQKHNHIIAVAREVCERFCFREISTPILEHTEVFSRTLGLHSDIVNKEMYTFKDRNETSLTLRPEGTAGIARHFITEKGVDQLPLRFMYQGPMFRYERPQKGRWRQFYTVGIELLGEKDFKGDIECLSLAWLFLEKLKIQDESSLEINSIGDKESRIEYQKALLDYLKPLKKKLSKLSQDRLQNNPLRILDSKEAQDIEFIRSAPSMQDFLNTRSRLFFENITNTLDSIGIPWTLNPLLVRGLDYYNHCIFECKSESEALGSQKTILAGGRYDPLIETMAGEGMRIPGLGWGAGIDRLRLLMKKSPSFKRPIALISLGEEAEKLAIQLAWQLREKGFCVFIPHPNNLGKKIKKANQMRAEYALIFGPEEIKNQKLSIKNLDKKEQKVIEMDQLIPFFQNVYS